MDALPDLVIHEILKSLSTKQAIRASILSKQWQRVWFSVPVLDFDEDEIEQLDDDDDLHANRLRRHIKFAEFVTMCLKRSEKDKSLHRLRLRIRMRYLSLDETCSSHIVRKCLRFAMNRHVKELYLAIIDGSESCFVLGNADLLTTLSLESVNVTLLSSAQHLTTLSLDDARISNYGSITFPSLKSISLKRVKVKERDLRSFHLNLCSSIENLSISGWYNLVANIEISSSSLKSLEFISFPERHARLQVEAMNLESLRVGSEKGKSWSSYTTDFASCGQLRNLELFGANFAGVCGKEFTSRFPLLQSLILYNCYVPWRTYQNR